MKRKKDLGKWTNRARELLSEGKSVSEITQTVAYEGYLNKQGTPVEYRNVYQLARHTKFHTEIAPRKYKKRNQDMITIPVATEDRVMIIVANVSSLKKVLEEISA